MGASGSHRHHHSTQPIDLSTSVHSHPPSSDDGSDDDAHRLTATYRTSPAAGARRRDDVRCRSPMLSGSHGTSQVVCSQGKTPRTSPVVGSQSTPRRQQTREAPALAVSRTLPQIVDAGGAGRGQHVSFQLSQSSSCIAGGADAPSRRLADLVAADRHRPSSADDMRADRSPRPPPRHRAGPPTRHPTAAAGPEDSRSVQLPALGVLASSLPTDSVD